MFLVAFGWLIFGSHLFASVGSYSPVANLQGRDSLLLRYEKVLRPLYNYDFTAAEENVRSYFPVETNPIDHHLLSLHLAWWHLISGYRDNVEWKESFHAHADKLVEFLEGKMFLTDEQRITLLNAYLFKSRVGFLHSNYLEGYGDLKTCVNLIEDRVSKSNAQPEEEFVFGIYNYYYNAAYEKSILLRPFLLQFPDGSKEVGMSILNKYKNSDYYFLSTEANYFLMKIYLESEETPDRALVYVEELIRRFPQNLLYRFYKIRCLVQLEKREEVNKYMMEVNNLLKDNNYGSTEKEFFQQLYKEEVALLE